MGGESIVAVIEPVGTIAADFDYYRAFWNTRGAQMRSGKDGIGRSTNNPGKRRQVFEKPGSRSRTRTYDRAINSRLLYQLSYSGPVGRLYNQTRWGLQVDTGSYLTV